MTGGAGFIGSHCCRDLLDNGYDVVVVDSLINSSEAVIDRICLLGEGNLSGRDLPYRIVERRPGDVPQLVASPALAGRDLGWSAKRTLSDICRDAWRFQLANPTGYGAIARHIGSGK